jgi:DNA-binding XRE family transcriptional regulator
MPHPWIAGRIDLGLRALEGRSAEGADAPLSFFDLTRWRRRRTLGLGTVEPRTLGERIREARLRLGMSQEAAGRVLGVSRTTLYYWEKDSVPVPRSRMAAVRRFLGRPGRKN